MKLSLNLGCGDRYADGWVNVDHPGCPHRQDQSVDLTGELPWEPGSVSRIYSGHMLEHITPEASGQLLKRLLSCADPAGCTMVLVGPDVVLAEQMVADGTFDHSWGTLDMIKYGAGRWAGDVHLWGTTGPLVARLVRSAGWPVVHHYGSIVELEGGWPVADRAQLWQYAVRAWKGPVYRGDDRDLQIALVS